MHCVFHVYLYIDRKLDWMDEEEIRNTWLRRGFSMQATVTRKRETAAHLNMIKRRASLEQALLIETLAHHSWSLFFRSVQMAVEIPS